LSAQLEPQPGEWIPLFNGHDLTGWEGGAAYWSVENGEIVGRLPLERLPRSTNLCTRRRFADFELRFQAKLPWGNSGIHVRSALIDRDAYVLRGPQIELADNHEAPWGSAITEPSSRNRLLAPIELVEGALRRGDYNDMRIRCQGVRVTVWLNDTMILDGNYKPLGIEGIVGLQLHRAAAGMEVRFRNLAIRELSPATGDR
jgi:hypothetical protein